MSARLKRIPIFGEGVYGKSAVVTRQRRLNVYLETRKDGDKSTIVAYGTPGLALQFNVSTPLNQPARGIIGNDSALYEVASNQIYSLSVAGVILASATLNTTVGNVGLALNPTQLMIVDGQTGYVFNTSTYVLTTSPAGFPAGARTVVYCNGFFICEQPGTNQFWVSALNDGTTWNGLSFAAAVQSVDGIAAVDTLGGLLVVFSYGHSEFWQNIGANPEPFQYIQNSAVSYGLEAVNGRCHVGDSIVFLAHGNGGSLQNTAGSYHICQIRGYTCQPVSTTDIDYILQQMARTSTIQDCTCYSYEQDEHQFAQFNFPTANRSLLWDATTGIWGEVQSGITQSYAARHLGNFGCSAFDKQLITDYSNGNVYTYDPGVYTDNGNTILREVCTRKVMNDFNPFRCGQLTLDMETGVGLASPSVQGYNPLLMISCSRDDQDFGAVRTVPIGKQGQNWVRAVSRRWGRARTSLQWKIQMTDPVKFVLTAGAARISSPRAGQ